MNATFNHIAVNAIKTSKGCQFISMAYVSVPTMNKSQKADFAGEVEKVVKGTFQIAYSYENAVNNRAEKECGEKVNFVSQPLRWGAWMRGQENKLIEHKGEIYLRFYAVKDAKVETAYFVGGKPATDEEIALIKQYTAKKNEIKTQTDAGLTENQVIARSVKIDNILEITIGGVTYAHKQLQVA